MRLGSPEAPVLPLPKFPSRRDLESEISALRAEFSALLVIAAQTPRVGRVVGAGTEPEDEDEADWEPDVVPRVDGARRNQTTARSAHSDCDLREQQPRGRWTSVTPEASPERGVDEEVDARQRGRSPTVLGCGRLELKKRHRCPKRRDERSGRDGRDTRPRGSYQGTGAEEHIQGARRALGFGGKAGTKERLRSAKRAGLRKSEQETALDVRYSELKRELKEIKRARQQLEVARADQLNREGRRRDWRPVDCPPVATSHLHQILQPMHPGLVPRNLRELETFSEIMDQLAAGQFGRAADVATQRYKATEMAMQDGDWKGAPHLELLPDGKRLLTGREEPRAHHQGSSARDEAEKISGRRPCSLAEGLGRQVQGPRKGQTLGQREMTPASQGPVQRKVQRQGQGSSSLEESGSPLVGGVPGPVGGRACRGEGTKGLWSWPLRLSRALLSC